MACFLKDEHSWATKRESTLSKKTFKCDPHRVLAKKLEPLVIKEIEALLFDDKKAETLFARVSKLHQSKGNGKQVQSFKAKIYGINSQIDALAERLSELPKEVSAEPIYKQMKTLEERKTSLEKELEETLMSGHEANYAASLKDYKSFLKSLRALWLTGTHSTKSKIIQRLLYKVEIGDKSLILHYNVDSRNLPSKNKKPSGKEGFLKSSSFLPLGGSNSLTFGAPRR